MSGSILSFPNRPSTILSCSLLSPNMSIVQSYLTLSCPVIFCLFISSHIHTYIFSRPLLSYLIMLHPVYIVFPFLFHPILSVFFILSSLGVYPLSAMSIQWSPDPSCLVLSCPVLSYLIWSSPILPLPVLSWFYADVTFTNYFRLADKLKVRLETEELQDGGNVLRIFTLSEYLF